MSKVHPVSNEGRRWTGTSMGGVLGYLDRAEKSSNNRVLRVLNLMLELEQPRESGKPSDVAHKKELLDDELSRYQFFPDIYPVESGNWKVRWHVVPRGRQRLKNIEAAVLEIILHFAAAGDINRLRKCTGCSRWIYAKFRHQLFCSMKCQQKNYGRSEKWKLYRRNYMRKYRRDTM